MWSLELLAPDIYTICAGLIQPHMLCACPTNSTPAFIYSHSPVTQFQYIWVLEAVPSSAVQNLSLEGLSRSFRTALVKASPIHFLPVNLHYVSLVLTLPNITSVENPSAIICGGKKAGLVCV